jgi:tetratricopeptide (TPR) repeat protein
VADTTHGQIRAPLPRLRAPLHREAGGRVDVAFADGAIEVAWEPQADQLPASATIARHLQAGRYDEAIPLLITRLQLEPDHALSLYNLGMVYSDRMQLKEAHEAEADELFHRALRLAPVGELAEKIKQQQRQLAARELRTNAAGKPRLDAVMDMTSALETYRPLDPAGQKQLLAEAAALGQKGLTINDPSQKHYLRHYQGGRTVSALQAACILDVGLQLQLPGQDAGIDLAREYELARGMVGGE